MGVRCHRTSPCGKHSRPFSCAALLRWKMRKGDRDHVSGFIERDLGLGPVKQVKHRSSRTKGPNLGRMYLGRCWPQIQIQPMPPK